MAWRCFVSSTQCLLKLCVSSQQHLTCKGYLLAGLGFHHFLKTLALLDWFPHGYHGEEQSSCCFPGPCCPLCSLLDFPASSTIWKIFDIWAMQQLCVNSSLPTYNCLNGVIDSVDKYRRVKRCICTWIMLEHFSTLYVLWQFPTLFF